MYKQLAILAILISLLSQTKYMVEKSMSGKLSSGIVNETNVEILEKIYYKTIAKTTTESLSKLHLNEGRRLHFCLKHSGQLKD